MIEDGALEAGRNEALAGWYRIHRRDLPWRDSGDPYLVLVSEFMLQQTQVSRVEQRFGTFVERFPSIGDLAAASLRDVLAAWSGLGYNRRAANLHETARVVSAQGWPRDLEGLQRLPGVGPYTARAISCFAFGRDDVPVDTNVRRVLSRWHGEPLLGAVLQAAAEADCAGSAAADWVQAVMDLGATTCTPRNPSCQGCPVVEFCTGPDVYVAPPKQARFEGSARQLRGALIRRLVAGKATASELVVDIGFDGLEVAAALEDLEAEGLVTNDGPIYRLPD